MMMKWTDDAVTTVVSCMSLQEDHPQPAILVVEDNDSLRYVLAEFLSDHGYIVITASTAQDAEAAMLHQHHGSCAYQLVIADIHLSRNDEAREGYALYQRWSALYPTLPFLLMSGDSETKELPAIRAGTVSYLAKPFDLDTFLETIQRLFKQR